MKFLANYFKNEPVAFIIGGIYGIIQAALLVALSYGLSMTAQQTIAINALVLAILVFAARGQVSPTEVVQAAKQFQQT